MVCAVDSDRCGTATEEDMAEMVQAVAIMEMRGWRAWGCGGRLLSARLVVERRYRSTVEGGGGGGREYVQYGAVIGTEGMVGGL